MVFVAGYHLLLLEHQFFKIQIAVVLHYQIACMRVSVQNFYNLTPSDRLCGVPYLTTESPSHNRIYANIRQNSKSQLGTSNRTGKGFLMIKLKLKTFREIVPLRPIRASPPQVLPEKTRAALRLSSRKKREGGVLLLEYSCSTWLESALTIRMYCTLPNRAMIWFSLRVVLNNARRSSLCA